MTRREIMKIGLAASAGLVASAAPKVSAKTMPFGGTRWVYLIDLKKCVGCGFCVRACKLENEIPYDLEVTRTWVERYIKLYNGKVIGDSPMGGRDGYTNNKPHGEYVNPKDIARAFFVPKLCNHCTNPACVQVCPVGATYQTEDGVVLVDRKWCIGCGYCIMACPYGVRFFHPKYKTAEKCTFCYHRIEKGMKPACVEACPFGTRLIGNLEDPNDPVTKIIKTDLVSVLKPYYGTEPAVYYLNFDHVVR